MRRWLLRGTISSTVAALSIGMFGSPAHAAMCIQWRTATTSHVGATVDIVFETFLPTGGGSQLRPQRFSEYPFRVTATSPDGRTLPIVVAPDVSGSAWRGQLRLETPGQWAVRSENFNGDTPCGPVLRIVAGDGAVASPLTLPIERADAEPVPPAEGRASRTWAYIGAGGLLAAAAAALVRRARRRSAALAPATGLSEPDGGGAEATRVSAQRESQYPEGVK